MSKTNLKVEFTQPEKVIPEFAIDEPYKKPTHKAPYFADDSKKIRKATALQKRFDELKRAKKGKPESTWDKFVRWFNGIK